jgi:hypothetical protein
MEGLQHDLSLGLAELTRWSEEIDERHRLLDERMAKASEPRCPSPSAQQSACERTLRLCGANRTSPHFPGFSVMWD